MVCCVLQVLLSVLRYYVVCDGTLWFVVYYRYYLVCDGTLWFVVYYRST